jgi:hypothetical protein
MYIVQQELWRADFVWIRRCGHIAPFTYFYHAALHFSLQIDEKEDNISTSCNKQCAIVQNPCPQQQKKKTPPPMADHNDRHQHRFKPQPLAYLHSTPTAGYAKSHLKSSPAAVLPQGDDPPPLLIRVGKADRNDLNEEITSPPLTGIGERYSGLLSP